MPERIYKMVHISKALNLHRKRYRDWLDQGFISATYPAKGQGDKPKYTLVDVIDIFLFTILVRQGFTRTMAKDIVGDKGKWRYVVLEGGTIIHPLSQLCTIRLETKGIMDLINNIPHT